MWIKLTEYNGKNVKTMRKNMCAKAQNVIKNIKKKLLSKNDAVTTQVIFEVNHCNQLSLILFQSQSKFEMYSLCKGIL